MNSSQLIKILEESYSETNLLNCIDVISYLEEVIEEKWDNFIGSSWKI